MKVYLKSSGGIGNVRMEGEVETSELPEELARKVEKVLAPAKLERLAAPRASRSAVADSPPGPLMGDVQEVELSVQTEDASSSRMRLNESQLPDEVLEVIDELRYELTRKRARALGRDVP